MKTLSILSLLFALFMLGCSGNVSLSGRVTFSDDGSPVPTGTVFFVTPMTVSQGVISKDGIYTMGTMSASDGLPKGEYQVYLGGVETVLERTMPDGNRVTTYTSLIDSKYTSPETSGLTFTVDGKTRKFDIQVERSKK